MLENVLGGGGEANVGDCPLPQDLCTCRSFCLKHSPPPTSHPQPGLPHLLQVLDQISYSRLGLPHQHTLNCKWLSTLLAHLILHTPASRAPNIPCFIYVHCLSPSTGVSDPQGRGDFFFFAHCCIPSTWDSPCWILGT